MTGMGLGGWRSPREPDRWPPVDLSAVIALSKGPS